MKYLAAFALASLSGNAPTKSTVEAILKAAGVPVDAARMDALFAELDGKDFEAVCSEGKAKLVGGAARPGAAGSAAAPAASSGPAAAAPAAAEEEDEDEGDMGFGLFD